MDADAETNRVELSDGKTAIVWGAFANWDTRNIPKRLSSVTFICCTDVFVHIGSTGCLSFEEKDVHKKVCRLHDGIRNICFVIKCKIKSRMI